MSNKILIIEDDLKFANELASCLQDNGFDTFHTDNIDDALKMIEEIKPTGISLDIQLKGSLGLNILKILTSDNPYNEYTPVVIIVSSFIGPQTLPILQKYQIPHYDKTLATFKYSLVADSFLIYFDTPTKKFSVINDNNATVSITPSLPTGDVLKNVIFQKLDIYGLNTKAISYKRLVEGIYYMLIPDKFQKDSLASIYIDVLDIDYNTAFTSIKRLLADSFTRNPEVFYKFYHRLPEEEIVQSKIKSIPTPSDFVFHIVTEIRKDYT